MQTSQTKQTNATPTSAFGVGAAVGILGGLIGLGGAEFRLPVLVSWFRLPMLLAIGVNLLVSIVTVTASLSFRLRVQGLEPLLTHWPIALNIICGSLIGAYSAAHFATKVPERLLIGLVAAILTGLGLLLMAHDWVLAQNPLTLTPIIRVTLALVAGLAIGTVSGLLGVAGGELIIPTLVLLFGQDIALAGTVSLLISIPTVSMGIFRYHNRGVLQQLAPKRHFVVYMALGSVLGAGIGSLLLPHAPSALLHVVLGAILLISAVKIVVTKRA
jgi:uncharacterized membrane protein YfcA